MINFHYWRVWRDGGDGYAVDNISGKYLEVDNKSRLKFTWRGKDWSPENESIVEIKLVNDEDDDGCKLFLTHSGIPKGELIKVEQTWMSMIFDRMRMIFSHTYNKL